MRVPCQEIWLTMLDRNRRVHVELNSSIAVSVNDCDSRVGIRAVSYTHLRAHETVLDIVCRLLLEKKTTS